MKGEKLGGSQRGRTREKKFKGLDIMGEFFQSFRNVLDEREELSINESKEDMD